MTTRRRSREVVLQVLYEDDVNTSKRPEAAAGFVAARLLQNKPLVKFAIALLDGVRARRDEIDAIIALHAANWSVKRMSIIDRNIIRIAVHEMTWADVPGVVAINEAIELAKRYGHNNSASFVNGILDRIHRENQKEDAKLSPA